MDLVDALQSLRRHWRWAIAGLVPVLYLALSTAYNVGPSGIHKTSIVYGSAQTQLLVDSQQSSLVETNGDVTNLSSLAQVFAQFFDTSPVQIEMARLMKVPTSDIAVTIPNVDDVTPSQIIPNAGQVNSGLLQESNALQLDVVSQPGLPLIDLNTQGPTGQAAAALANAAAQALADYVNSLKGYTFTKAELKGQAGQTVLPPSRVTVEQLGTANGAMVDPGTSIKLAILAFVGLGILDCILVIIVGGFVDRSRGRSYVRQPVAASDLGTLAYGPPPALSTPTTSLDTPAHAPDADTADADDEAPTAARWSPALWPRSPIRGMVERVVAASKVDTSGSARGHGAGAPTPNGDAPAAAHAPSAPLADQ